MKTRDLKSVMGRIARGDISRAAAARALGVSERQVNRLMKERGVARPASARARLRRAASLEAKHWREELSLLASEVAAGRVPLRAAAVDARVSLRTLYRWVEKAKKLRKK